MAATGVVALMCVFLVIAQAELMGKTNFVVTKVGTCPQNSSGDIDFKSIKLYKINRDSFIDADIISKIPFDDKLKLTMKFSQWLNGGFKPRLSMPVGGVCSGLKTALPGMFKTVTTMVHASDCPLPPSNYSLRKFSANFEITLPVPTGKYRSAMLFFKNDQLIGCVLGEANAFPKKSG
ncbi:hypothetical protein GE061_011564 [Apolygus lucorum]|uniref:MD-2-related lipid-recognition domain-containing protein n=1 Tax=Apolygus lucorum TaxID=248454 RepID=A0A8S9XZU2_APOLU|nr:hypothetical protein GE061_011564 [Apolygus lucorum]